MLPVKKHSNLVSRPKDKQDCNLQKLAIISSKKPNDKNIKYALTTHTFKAMDSTHIWGNNSGKYTSITTLRPLATSVLCRKTNEHLLNFNSAAILLIIGTK